MVLNRNSFCGPLKPVILGDKILSYVNSSVYLGVVIDSRLSWQPQITAVCKSFSRKVKNLTQLRVLPRRVLEAIYFRSIVPRVTDGLLVWGTCTLSLLCDVELIHLRAATLKRTHWQPLTNVYKLKLTSLMYLAYYGLIPKPIRGPIVWNVLPESYKLSDSHESFKKKIKKDQVLLDKLSFEKESCLITNKDDDFYYF